MSWRIFTHHALKGALRSVQLLLFVALPAVILWLQFAGLPRFLHEPVIEAARKEGLDLNFSRMRVSIFQGLVLDNVRLSAKNLPENNEVAVDRASLAVNWRELLHGKFAIGALELRGAQLYLPVQSADGVVRSLRLSKARARLALADGVVSVPLARFNLQGIEVTATGQVALLSQDAPRPSENLLPPEIGRAIEILEAVDFGSRPPTLNIEFSAAGGTSGTWQLPVIRFEAPRASLGVILLRDIGMEASFLEGVFTVRRLAARDGRSGSLQASGRWDTASGEAQAELESSLDPAGWMSELLDAKQWKDLKFSNPPVIRATLEAPAAKPRRLQLLGTIESDAFGYRGMTFGGFESGFVWREGGEFYADKISVRTPSGPIKASLMIRPGDVRARIDCRADPLPLLPLLGNKVKETVEKMQLKFRDPPLIRLEATGAKPEPAALRAEGQLEFGRSSIHGSEMDRATADVSFENLALTLSNIQVARPEGTGSGSFTYDFANKQVRLTDIRSTMKPFNVLQWADPKVARETEPYRFKAPPDVTVNGLIDLANPSLTRLEARFNAAQGLEYDLLDRTLSFGEARGTLRFEGRQILVDVPAARLYGGNVRMNAVVTTGQPGARQQMTVDLERVNFETLTRLYFDYQDSKGLLSGRYNFSFVPGKAELMRGQGNLLVEDGNVFAIPVLGPLSFLLDSVIPGAGYQTSRRATCDYTVANGEIRTDNLDVQGQGFVMIGKGSLFFVKDRMDFSVRVNAQGVPGILLYPVSKLFEYVSDGKMTEPKWRPRILPKNETGDRDAKPPEKEEKPKAPSGGARPNGRA
jgi:hypothetical protein